MGDRSETSSVHDSLGWEVELETTAEHSSLVLSNGPAAATFSWQANPRQRREVLPQWGGQLYARDRTAGAAFVERIARWLDVPLPGAPEIPGVPTGMRYSAELMEDAGAFSRDGWRVYDVSTGDAPQLSMLLRIDEGQQRAELINADTTRGQEVVEALAVGLRDGPKRARLPGDWSVDEPPLVSRVNRLFRGQYLNCVETEVGLVGSRRDGQTSVVFRWDDCGAMRREVARVDGIVSTLAGSQRHPKAAAVVVRPSNSRGMGIGDPAALITLDGASGKSRTILSPGTADPFGALAWSPNGRYLAVELAGKRIGIVDASVRRVIEKVPVVGGELLRWDARGVWVRVPKQDASGWFEAHLWNPETNALQAVTPTRSVSPDGAFDVRQAQGQLVVSDAQGAERSIAYPDGGPVAPDPGFPGEWLDASRLVLVGEEPVVLDASTLSMRYLLPRSRVRDFSVTGEVVVFAPRQGERWCGRLEL